MRHAIKWVAKYGDEFVAIVLALAVAGLASTDVISGSTIAINTVLLVLAAITASNLRDRFRSREMHRELVTQLQKRAAQLEESNNVQTAELRRALDAGAQVRILTGNQITLAHASAREDTSVWAFRGGTGTYLRAVTLPECVARARMGRRRLEVRIEILDPRSTQLCSRYAGFRDTLKPHHPDGVGELWTAERTRKESYATILAACWYHQHYEPLDIAVGLSNRMTTFRWDLSSQAVILTQEDPSGQALLFTSDKAYYRYWEIELRNSFQQTDPVRIAAGDSVELGEEPSIEDARELFKALGLPLPGTYSEREVAEIVTKAIRARNPYE